MLFNSIDFFIFLPIVFFLYWLLAKKGIVYQNTLIVIASYVFYGWWDWRFLFLIIFSTIINYAVGLKIIKAKKARIFLLLNIVINLTLLGLFKYYNFFIDNFIIAFSFFGEKINISHLNIILPLGISFYTFQTMSYSVDVFRKKIEPTKDLIAFAAFVSFFPQLVAGPIERAAQLLPQFYQQGVFTYHKAVDGCRQILWGFFKKVVIADNCAVYANMIFDNSKNYSGSTLMLGALFFTFQIYGDFSGYSDIAIGVSRLFGINLMKNFAYPYFSRDIAEFWRRWHISLTTWFRDYVYIPLGGSRYGTWISIRNTLIIFLLSGFWHGAEWNFIIWGGVNAIYFLPLLFFKKNRIHIDVVAEGCLLPSINELFSMGMTFILTVFAWIFFRAENIDHAVQYLLGIFSLSLFTIPQFGLIGEKKALFTIFLIFILIIVEWIHRNKEFGLQISHSKLLKYRIVRWMVYVCLILVIIAFKGKQSTFIYFQF